MHFYVFLSLGNLLIPISLDVLSGFGLLLFHALSHLFNISLSDWKSDSAISSVSVSVSSLCSCAWA